MRRTKTSSEVKDRYNRKHYEQLTIRTAHGGRAAIQELAELHGMSMTQYIRHLVIADGQKLGKDDISAILGGGGAGAEKYCGFLADTCRELNGWSPFQDPPVPEEVLRDE